MLDNNYDQKCDLWSIGVILYILLCGYPPFNGATDDQIIKKVKAGKFRVDDEEWETISDQAIDLVHKLLEYDPSKRISAAQALHHEWIVEKSVVQIDTNLARKTLSNLKNFSVGIKNVVNFSI